MNRLVVVLLVLVAAPLGAQGQQRGTNADVPATHRPPPGMCRIWIDGVPPGRQPAPTDCATALRRRPPNARVIFGDEVRVPRTNFAPPPRTDATPRTDAPPRSPTPPITPLNRPPAPADTHPMPLPVRRPSAPPVTAPRKAPIKPKRPEGEFGRLLRRP